MESGIVFIGIVAAFLIAAWILGKVNQKRFDHNLRSRFLSQFGRTPDKAMKPERYMHVPEYFKAHPEAFEIDEITWNDLDMDDIYRRIDCTVSAAGEEYLYYLLRTPCVSDETPAERLSEQALAWFSKKESEEERLRYQSAFYRLGSTGNHSMYEFLDRLDTLEGRSNVRHILALILPLAALAFMYVSTEAGIILLIGVLCWNIATYFKEKRAIDPFLISFKYLLRLIECAQAVSGISSGSDVVNERTRRLKELCASMRAFRAGSGITMSSSNYTGNPADVIMEYVRILFHLDILKFNQMYASVKAHRQEIDEMITLIGQLDTEIAVASFRMSLPHFCVPVFRKSTSENTEAPEPQVRITELFHPLLNDPVCNDIRTDGCVLLTGSNASGKSTFLKAVALCALLGESLQTVPAASYTATRFRIYSSMALRDSIQNSESYFMAEIRSLKRVLDACGENSESPVLCFIDEVLRGTNTIERIAASTQILENLAGNGVLCFAATHDIELTKLLKECFVNYHFEEELQGNDVTFSYRLMDGPATTRNAILLLKNAGFPEEVTQKAKERAEAFESTGKWTE